MITGYFKYQSSIQQKLITSANKAEIQDAAWLDLLSPTDEEEKWIEEHLQLDIPTKQEMEEIEPSNRLYKEDNVLFMTATMLAKSDSPQPQTDAVTFILTNSQLITVRYVEPQSFALFTTRLARSKNVDCRAELLFSNILEATVDRLADILEKISHQLDQSSIAIFHPEINGTNKQRIDYNLLLQAIGANGDLETKVRESLISFNRLVYYFSQNINTKENAQLQSDLSIIIRDIDALSSHANFISSKVSFLLNATLGMVNIEQNNIIKIFSVAAVIFLPPTLIASIYGMNFQLLPELQWRFGYPFAIFLMLVSAWLPYRYFKKKKWL